MRARSHLLLCVILGHVLRGGEARVKSGKIEFSPPDLHFMYLAKFCFATQPRDIPDDESARFSYRVDLSPSVNTSAHKVYVKIYDDEPSSWPKIAENSGLSCQDKLSFAIKSMKKQSSYGLLTQLHNEYTILLRQHVRPRWWYVAVVSCDAPLPPMEYTVTFINPWGSHFSYEKNGLLQVFLCALVLLLPPLLIVCLACIRRLRAGNRLGSAARILQAAIVIELVSRGLFAVHFGVYARDGRGVMVGDIQVLRVIAEWSDGIAVMLIIFLLLVLGSGASVHRGLTRAGLLERKAFMMVSAAYLSLYIGVIMWFQFTKDRYWSTGYMYDLAPGKILMVGRTLLCFFFVLQVRLARKLESDMKRARFYTRLGVLGALWMAGTALMVLIGNFLPSYYQEIVTLSGLLALDTIALYALVAVASPRSVELISEADGRAYESPSHFSSTRADVPMEPPMRVPDGLSEDYDAED